jgi:ribosomal protein L17
MKQLKILAIAAATGRIGYVFLIGGKLRDWGLSRKASKSPALAAAQTQTWINELQPDVVVTEKVSTTSTKGTKTRHLIEAIAKVATRAKLLDVAVSRLHTHKNKYEEAKYLGERFPEINAWVPRMRRIWEPEPRNTILFEALALACVVVAG